MNDLRYALRLLARGPMFAIGVTMTLALGVGASTAIFSVANAVLLNPLPYQDSTRLVSIRELNPGKGVQDEPVSGATFLEWKSQNHSFVDMAALTGFFAKVTLNDEPELLFATSVTTNYFSLLGVKAKIGTTFADEDVAAREQVVVLSNSFWQRQFGGNPDALGTTISLNGRPHKIIGVLPADFMNARVDYKPPSLWVPMTLKYDSRSRRGGPFAVIARLAPGVSLEQATTDTNVIETRLEQEHPESNGGWRASAIPLRDVFVGPTRSVIYVLAGAVGVLLLIAWVNISNLLLSRATARKNEIAIRLALGAQRSRVVRQLLTESLLMSLLGGSIGALLSYWGLNLLIAVAPGSIPLLDQTHLDLRVLGFTLVVSALSGVVVGVIPAFVASREELSAALKDTNRGIFENLTGRRLRSALASMEIALSLLLLISAGLFAKSLIRLQQIDLGFNPDRTLVGMLALPPSKYGGEAQVAAFYRELVSRVSALPGVTGAAAASEPPLAGGNLLIEFTKDERPETDDGDKPVADSRKVTPDYFGAIGVRLLAGRIFSEYDDWNAKHVVIINKAMAQRYWPDQDPIGRSIRIDSSDWQVVGIVGNVKNESLTSAPYPQIYFPYTQMTARSMMLFVRSSNEPSPLLPAVKATIKEMDGEQVLTNITTLSGMLASEIARPQFNTLLISIFAVVAIALASVGVYGVISFSVSQRTAEIGIRVALGASHGNIFRLVVSHGLRVSVTGLVFGLFGAYAVTSLFSAMLFGVAGNDLFVFAGATVVIATVAFAATCIPASRAARLDPIAALRRQ